MKKKGEYGLKFSMARVKTGRGGKGGGRGGNLLLGEEEKKRKGKASSFASTKEKGNKSETT